MANIVERAEAWDPQPLIEQRFRKPIVYNGELCVTFEDIDAMHGKAGSNSAARAFRRNREEFVEGEHCYSVARKELQDYWSLDDQYSKSRGNPNVKIWLVNKYGYPLVIKTFRDKLAWKIYKQLVKFYFERVDEIPKSPVLSNGPWGRRVQHCFMLTQAYVVKYFPDYFLVGVMVQVEILAVEDVCLKHLIPLEMGDSPDGSIGQHWSTFRTEQRANGAKWLRKPERVKMNVPTRPQPVEVNIYHHVELPHFNTWFRSVYMPEKFPKYLEGKKARQGEIWLARTGREVTDEALGRAAIDSSRQLGSDEPLLTSRQKKALGLALPAPKKVIVAAKQIEGMRQQTLF